MEAASVSSGSNYSANWTNLTGISGFAPYFLTPRLGAGFAYDDYHREGILFGGQNSSGFNNQTFSYTDGSWSEIIPWRSPPARAYSSFADYPGNRNLVLFGGIGPGHIELNDTWSYSSGSWTQQAVNGPSPRENASFAWDSADGELVLFGGTSNGTQLNDTWVWRGAVLGWVQLTQTGPSPPARGGAGLATDPQGGGVDLFGGWNGTSCRGDTWRFLSGVWSRLVEPTSPPPRCDAAMTYDSESGVGLLFGGRGSHSSASALNDTWEFTNGNWSRIASAQAPGARFGAAITDCLRCGALGLFGGRGGSSGVLLNDTWKFRNVVAQIHPFPPAGSAPLNVSFNSSAFGGLPPYTYEWNLGDGNHSNASSPSHIYPRVGTYGVSLNLTESGGLVARDSVPIVVETAPTAAATGTPGHGEAPLSVSFVGQVIGGSAPFRYAWNFADGGSSTKQTANHTFLLPGNYSVGFQTTDRYGVTARAQTNVAVYASLLTQIVANVSRGDAPLQVGFTGVTSGGLAPYAYRWVFGDGILGSGASPKHEYVLAGNYTATLNVSDSSGVHAQSSLTIQVKPTLLVQIIAEPSAGPTPLTVRFSSTVSGGSSPYGWSWAFGDGSVSSATTPTHTYSRPGAWNVSLAILDSWYSRAVAQVVITSSPPLSHLSVALSAHPSLGAPPLTVHLSATVVGGSGPYTGSWNFGDGATGDGLTVNHTYVQASTYDVSFVVTDSGGSTATSNLTVVVELPATSTSSGFPGWTVGAALAGTLGLVGLAAVAWVLNRRRTRSD